jgi:hypothetical protein
LSVWWVGLCCGFGFLVLGMWVGSWLERLGWVGCPWGSLIGF